MNHECMLITVYCFCSPTVVASCTNENNYQVKRTKLSEMRKTEVKVQRMMHECGTCTDWAGLENVEFLSWMRALLTNSIVTVKMWSQNLTNSNQKMNAKNKMCKFPLPTMIYGRFETQPQHKAENRISTGLKCLPLDNIGAKLAMYK